MRLSNSSLSIAKARLPYYNRALVQAGIVHIGMGAFHRAHQAVYIDDLLSHDPNWAIVGASLQSAKTANALNPQDGLYTVVTKHGNQSTYRVIGSVTHVLCAQSHRNKLIKQLCNPNIKIVSLTITEKGYYRVPATGQLDSKHPDIQRDIEQPTQPKTALGFIVEALRIRCEKNTGPFTVLSCDNLPLNGNITKGVVTELAHLQDPGLAQWITDHVSFPSTMVDRIVPATSKADLISVEKAINTVDKWPVVTEPFSQWVIEDDFCAGRPAFENAGAILTKEVEPFEKMKLRLLNGSHSAIAYLGLLHGYKTVAEAMNDPTINMFVEDMMTNEICTTIDAPDRIDLPSYQKSLLERFRNPDLHHQLSQIAMDGSQKLPQRILEPIRDRLEKGQTIAHLAHVIAAWLQTVCMREGEHYHFELQDPLASELRFCNKNISSPSIRLELLLLKHRGIFGDDLACSDEFQKAVIKAFDSKLVKGTLT